MCSLGDYGKGSTDVSILGFSETEGDFATAVMGRGGIEGSGSAAGRGGIPLGRDAWLFESV